MNIKDLSGINFYKFTNNKKTDSNSLINQNIDMLHLTPEIANGLTKINSNSLEKETVNAIHKIICTGSYLYGATKEDFEKKFQKRLYSCYGLTEIGGPITLQNWEDTFEENSVGIVLDEVKIKIIKKNGLNHINVKSPYLFEGYILTNGKIEKPKLSQGYFDTGDIGFVNKNLHYHKVHSHSFLAVPGTSQTVM